MILKTLKMIMTKPGSIDGISIQRFEKDRVYDVSEDLFNSFLKMKVAIPVERTTPVESLADQKKRVKEDKETERIRLKKEKIAAIEAKKADNKAKKEAEKKQREELKNAKEGVNNVNKEDKNKPDNKEAPTPDNKEAKKPDNKDDDSEEEDELDDFVTGEA